jgi:hypothetical protein
MLGKTPKELGIEVEGNSWDKVVDDKWAPKVYDFSEVKLNKLLVKPVTVTSVTRSLIQHSLEVTHPMRNYMQQNPGKRAPSDYTLFPGKLDHTTCLAAKICLKKASWIKASLQLGDKKIDMEIKQPVPSPTSESSNKKRPSREFSEYLELDIPCVLEGQKNDSKVYDEKADEKAYDEIPAGNDAIADDPDRLLWNRLFGEEVVFTCL